MPASLRLAVNEEVPEIVNQERFSDVPKLVCKYGDIVFYKTRRFIAELSIFETCRNFQRKSLIHV